MSARSTRQTPVSTATSSVGPPDDGGPSPATASSSPPTGVNTVVLRGRLSSEPRRRELPSGDVMVSLEATTNLPGSTFTVPVTYIGELPSFAPGDEVIIVGSIRRRFYRAGGATQSRTEVLASCVLRPRQRSRVERALARARAALALIPDV